ncbi:DUF4240 domain-containing protein [Microbispora bryophytorum]|uniref:DUF4240 domain-containing protein n=1 Tax=Microbispora bryophytorum subsp. camponoti TaxID=1677852 RepID=A0ABR8KWR7_9ACTN|nr:DUF4240 domain-containing protein [Microbispora camponoti]MBD3143180.1 DUF4240 domain-containing protein [Microbispora camponoti]
MDEDRFWELIERSDRETRSRKERLAWLNTRLCQLSADEIIDYHMWWELNANRGYTCDMYALSCYLLRRESTDGFEYFIYWLMSLGREAYDQVADCPDRVMELPQVVHLLDLKRRWFAERRRGLPWSDEEYPGFELLAYVALDAYEQVTGENVDILYAALKARGVRSRFPLLAAEFGEQDWDIADDAEVARRLPRLARYLTSPN